MTETITLIDGIENESGTICRSATLAEATFRHTLEALNDPDAKAYADDNAGATALIMAKRLKVDGIERVTAAIILDLSPEDGDLLLQASARLQQRRTEFRRARTGGNQAAGGASEAGG